MLSQAYELLQHTATTGAHWDFENLATSVSQIGSKCHVFPFQFSSVPLAFPQVPDLLDTFRETPPVSLPINHPNTLSILAAPGLSANKLPLQAAALQRQWHLTSLLLIAEMPSTTWSWTYKTKILLDVGVPTYVSTASPDWITINNMTQANIACTVPKMLKCSRRNMKDLHPRVAFGRYGHHRLASPETCTQGALAATITFEKC